MDNSNRIAELEERKRQIDVEIAFDKGFRIEGKSKNWDVWSDINNPEFKWITCDYRIKEEPKRIPFDYTDIPNLLWKKFKHNNDRYEEVICVGANEVGVILPYKKITYDMLAEDYDKWNELLNKWEPCTKIA